MKRAEAKVVRTPFFQLHETANNINDVEAAQYLLYGSLGNHRSSFRDCEYKFILSFRKAKNHLDDG